MFRSLVLITLCALAATAQAQSACSHYALVSGYFSNVHILDACSGAYLRDLDAQSNRLRGPQAIKLGPDGALWVVSERNAQINRYSAEDFTYLSAPIGVGTGFGVTGFDFRGQEVYVGGYDADSVRRYSLTGQLLGTAVPANAGVGGPDNGLAFGPDGLLYVPGFDTHNVLRHNPATGQNAVLVPGGSGGLRNTRGILFRPDGETFLVSSEGSGQVLEYRRDNGALVRELVRGLVGPTGLAWAPDGSLAVLDQGGVQLRDPGTGELRRNLVGAGSGLSGPTYVAFVRNPAATAPPSPSQIGTQFWISGAGRLDGPPPRGGCDAEHHRPEVRRRFQSGRGGQCALGFADRGLPELQHGHHAVELQRQRQRQLRHRRLCADAAAAESRRAALQQRRVRAIAAGRLVERDLVRRRRAQRRRLRVRVRESGHGGRGLVHPSSGTDAHRDAGLNQARIEYQAASDSACHCAARCWKARIES
jgi:hypothetical protein